MATAAERIAVVETKVANLDEKMDHIQCDIRDNHQSIIATLQTMRDESTRQHNELAGKVKELEGFKNKWARWAMMGLAFLAGAGWLGNANLPVIVKFLGL
jgi:predicted  nucleic acid-binding Zn-ribbon protein